MNIVSLHEQGIEASKKALKKFLEMLDSKLTWHQEQIKGESKCII